jgi:hypothetical protein
MKSLGQGRRCADRDSNRAAPDSNSGALLPGPVGSVSLDYTKVSERDNFVTYLIYLVTSFVTGQKTRPAT